MSSIENPGGEATDESWQLLVPTPMRIRIVRDAILAFLGSIVLMVILLVVAIAVARVAGGTNIRAVLRSMTTPGWLVPVLVVPELCFLAFGIYLRRRYRSQGHILPGLFEGNSVSAIMRGIGTGFALVVVGLLCAALAIKFFGKASTDSRAEVFHTLSSLKGRPLIVFALVLTIAFLAPICEEFFFRGALYDSVRSTRQAWAGAIVSSVLFGVAHLNPALTIYYLIVGFTMCRLLSKTKTLAAPSAAHMTINSLVCIAVLTAR
jgi:hypothetical protein